MKFILIKINKIISLCIFLIILLSFFINTTFLQTQITGCTIDDIATITDISFLHGHNTIVQGELSNNTTQNIDTLTNPLQTTLPNTQISQVSPPLQTAIPLPTPEQKRVFLTFDDGPSKTTADVLDVLKEAGVPATFFVIAAENNAKYFPLVERIFAEGHQIGLHTSSHNFEKIYQSTEAFWTDIELLKSQLSLHIDTESINYVRFPGGSTNTIASRYGGSGIMKELKSSCEDEGYYWIDWNVCADDAVGGNPNADEIFENTIEDIQENQNEAVVLMHDTHSTSQTVKALPQIIDWFQSQGYKFCRIDELH